MKPTMSNGWRSQKSSVRLASLSSACDPPMHHLGNVKFAQRYLKQGSMSDAHHISRRGTDAKRHNRRYKVT